MKVTTRDSQGGKKHLTSNKQLHFRNFNFRFDLKFNFHNSASFDSRGREKLWMRNIYSNLRHVHVHEIIV